MIVVKAEKDKLHFEYLGSLLTTTVLLSSEERFYVIRISCSMWLNELVLEVNSM